MTPRPTRAASDRLATAIAVSKHSYPADQSAKSVVLASGAAFPDALAGTPLAVRLTAPLLLTSPGHLDDPVAAEISRVLPKGSTVVILGGSNAVATSVDGQLSSMGYTPSRIAGTDRFQTAAAIAHALGDPTTVVEVNGLTFADALAGGTAAVKLGGALLLTNGQQQAGATASYLAAHPGGTHYALGGPAAAADAGADPIVGQDRYETAALAADAFFNSPPAVGVAFGGNFPDALAGGAELGKLGGPILLTNTNDLPQPTANEASNLAGSVNQVLVYGGALAVSDQVAGDVLANAGGQQG